MDAVVGGSEPAGTTDRGRAFGRGAGGLPHRHAGRCHRGAGVGVPLHPPGKPEKTRADELLVDLPLRVVQGQRDLFGRPEEFPPGLDLVAVPGDHSLRKGLVEVVAAVLDFV